MTKQTTTPTGGGYIAPQIETIDITVEAGFAITKVTGEGSSEEDY